MKVCSKCKIEKSDNHFNKKKSTKDGLQYRCRECQSDNMKRYYSDNSDKLKDYQKEYRCNNTNKVRDAQKKYRQSKKAHLTEYVSEWKLSNANYITYQPQLELYGVECRRLPEDDNILEVKCWYDGCGKWHIPTNQQVRNKLGSVDGHTKGECNLYCSDECKQNCPTFGQKKYYKGMIPYGDNGYRRHQAELRSILIEERGTVCEKCGIDVGNKIICHHILPVKTDPLESLDKDNCILVCYECDQTIHQKDGCTTGQLSNC